MHSMRGTRLWLVVGLVLALTAAMIAAGCGDDDDDDGGTAAEDLGTLEEGQLLVGTDAPFPPFEIGQPGSPDFGGYDIDVMNAIAEELGLEVTYQNTGFAAIFRDTANGLFDTAAAASTILPERERVVDFTNPYYEAQQALLVAEGSDIASVNDITSDTILGAQDGTTGETYANDETDAGEVRGYPQGPDAVSGLITGQVDAVIIDEPVAVDAVDKQGGVEIAEVISTDELYGFAVAPQNDSLREAMNDAIDTLREDGTITDLYEEYFNTEPPPSVLEGTNEQLTND
jgi:polar amino acid transport system substrate-binding protein